MDFRKITKAAKAQGWQVVPLKSGAINFIPPAKDAEIVNWHSTPSDVRQSGTSWPP